MVRFASIVAAAGAGALAWCGPASAAPEITLAAIATGRLYIVGTTERPHVPVVLEDKFRTESDEKGRFQYELVYHPSRCIVSATIDGKTVEAVVSNCGQTCEAAPQPAAVAAAARALPAGQAAPPVAGSAAQPPRGVSNNRSAVAPPPNPSAAPTGTPDAAPKNVQIARPPRPPQRPAVRTPPQARTVQPAKPARKPRPAQRPAPDDAGPPVAD